MHFLVGWSWIAAALFGVLIAATDPVSVIATFKEIRPEQRLGLLVEAESLLNDGAAAVGFAVLLALTGGSAPEPALKRNCWRGRWLEPQLLAVASPEAYCFSRDALRIISSKSR